MRRAMNQSPRSLYFVNWWIDAAAIGGLSIVAFVIARLFADGGTRTMELAQAGAILAVFVNYPHFSATIYRLYENPDSARQFPVTAYVLPFLLLGAVAASLWQPALIAPYFVLLFLIWSPYHYSGQTLGITMIYARRAGFQVARWQRLALSTFIFSTFVVALAHRQSGEPTTSHGVVLPSIPFPDWFAPVGMAVMWAGAAVFLCFVIDWCRTHRRMLPPIVLLPAASQFVWFMPGIQTAAFYEFVPLFHSLQYLFIAWAMQISLHVGREGQERSWRAIRAVSMKWGLWNYAGGLALFIGLPWLFFWVPVPTLTVVGVVIAAINIHHFFVDGVIWKLRHASSASPLMTNVTDLAAQPRPASA
jgi:hypothetical protein